MNAKKINALAVLALATGMIWAQPSDNAAVGSKENEGTDLLTAVVDYPAAGLQLMFDDNLPLASGEDSALAQHKKKDKKKGKVYEGEATYYNDKYQGKATASGEPYDMNKYTAAIRKNALPLEFGTIVEVTNAATGKSVQVKVNDKMGDNARSIIDLSRAAAEEIGLIRAGRLKVTVRVIESGGK